MKCSLMRTMLCVTLAGGALSAQAMEFLGMQNTGGWPGSSLGARADWSSSLGEDWVCGYADDGFGNAVGWGQGSFSQSRPFQVFDAGHTAGWELDRRGGAVGETFSGGEVSVGPASAGSQWSSFWHLYSELGENNPGHGIGTTAYAATYYAFQPQGENVYWAMTWTLDIQTQGETRVAAWLNGLTYRNGGAGPTRSLIDTTLGNGVTSLSGSEFGGPCTYGYSGQILPNFEIGTTMNDYAEHPGQGRMDLRVNITFSSSPVPEPSPLITIGAGIGVVVLTRRLKRRI